MRFAALAGLIVLGSCSDGPDAEKRFQMVSGTGSPRDTCVEAGKVKDAYLADGDQANYKRWVAREDQECAAARLCEASPTKCR